VARTRRVEPFALPPGRGDSRKPPPGGKSPKHNGGTKCPREEHEKVEHGGGKRDIKGPCHNAWKKGPMKRGKIGNKGI